MLGEELPLWGAFFNERYGGASNDTTEPIDAGRVRHEGKRLRIGGTDGRTLRGSANILNYLTTFAAAAD